ncbi:MAG: 3-hydroxybutyryl-CoA dehydrogenase [Chloroflexota bacterium]|nr:3-hydroxybutyryl-CoA dehydrogenase [Chloroflexota bacterium]
MDITKVGVVGSGQMGSGIAQVCALSGYQTILAARSSSSLDRGLENINSALLRAIAGGWITEEVKSATLARIHGTTKIEDIADCDLVIEAIVENMEEKKKLFAELDRLCPVPAILASNTSCLSVTEMALATENPGRVIGLHFFNPPPVMALLELITTVVSSEETFNIARKFAESLKKTVVVVKDTPGFIVNRLLIPFLLDAIWLLESGLATKEDIDTSMVLGCNQPMGPLRIADFIGLDTLNNVADAICNELDDVRFAVPPILRKMVAAGYLGRKTGRGFYEYD